MTDQPISTNLIAWRSWLHGCDWGYRPIPVCGISVEVTENAEKEWLAEVKDGHPIVELRVN